MKKLFTTLAFCVLALASNGQAFFTQTTYRGAFGTGAGANWTSGWASFDPKNVAYPGDNGNNLGKVLRTVADSLLITGNVTWSSDTCYLLSGQVFVKAGGVLTIQPGTVIRGINAPAGANPAFLCVAQGGKLIAVGTPTSPIVFTSNNPPSTRTTGDWGGLMICGNARVNLQKPPITFGTGRRFEATPGYPETFYGGTDDNDNSGSLKYVRVEFAGDARAVDQELNGLMLAGVGRNTSIDFVQVSFANDDSYEWFGGSVNAKHLIALGGSDDDFDMDEGFTGKVQFALAVKHPNFFDPSGSGNDNSNGFEVDNNTTSGGTATSSQVNASPLPCTSPVFSNSTMVGPLRSGENSTAVSNAFGWGVNFRTQPAFGLFNSIVYGYQQAVRSNTPNITGITFGAGTPTNFSKFQSDSATIKNTAILEDAANTLAAPMITLGGNLGAGSPFFGTATAGAQMHTLLAGRGVTFDSTSSLTPATLGITTPYYTGTIAATTFGSVGTSSYATFNPTLTAGSPYLTGAAFTDARLTPSTLGTLEVFTTLSPSTSGTYDNIIVQSTGVVNLTGNLSVLGSVIVNSGGQVNMGTHALTNTSALIVNNGGTVRTANANGMSATGSIQSTGGVTFNSGSNLVYNGSSAQVTGNLVSSVGGLEVANSTGVTVNAPLTVNGILDLTSGTLATGGNLTIGTSANRQGIIDDFSAGNSGTVTGSIKFNRLTTGNFRHMSAPVAGATIDAITAAGFTGSNIREFNEVGNNWILADVTPGTPIDPMSSRIAISTGGKVVQFTGTLSTGLKSATMVRTAPVVGISKGWNGLGNPYPSPIRWSLVDNIAANTGVTNFTAFVWNSTLNNYGTITVSGAVTGGANDVIAAGQGFLVRTIANGNVLTLNNTVRVAQSTPSTFIRTSAENEVLRMTFSTATGGDEITANTNGEVAEKLFSPVATAPALYILGEEPMTVASYDAITADTRIELGIKGEGVVRVEAINAPAGLTAYVVNSRTGAMMVAEGASFNASSEDRFSVVFRKGSAANVAANLYAFRANNNIHVVLNGNTNGTTVELFDAAGKLVSSTSVAANQAEATIAEPATPGVYQVRVSGSVNGATRVAAGF